MTAYDYALAATPDNAGARTPFEDASGGYSIGMLDGRYILTDPAGHFVTSDLHAIVEMMKECHPTARRVIGRDAAANAARIDNLNTTKKENPNMSTETAAGIVECYTDPAAYTMNLEVLPLSAIARNRLNIRLRTWTKHDPAAGFVLDRGRIALDTDNPEGVPDAFRVNVPHVVFVALPPYDLAYRPTGEIDPTGGECAAVLVSPATWKRDGVDQASWYGGTFHAVRFFASLQDAEAQADELREAVWQMNEPTRAEKRAAEKAQRDADREAGVYHSHDDDPF